MITIWHNPRCSKSRQALQLLQDRGLDVTERLYLQDPPSEAELRAAHAMLGGPVLAMMRPREDGFKTAGLTKDSDDDALFAAMAADPKLIERPVVFANGKAALGRPPEAVLAIL
ncbi:arsenate reductase (glutaredoxin) [Mesobacterium pallidum]|uniref:arsenate reductase (glutaredoxin) n=1 Tax=Mesobacterium pallidum TaxID=2872037 RepID=UPI001EE23073|nr:arsenate reductase (glutaredoxin) [Mesobacterium pallidum]